MDTPGPFIRPHSLSISDDLISSLSRTLTGLDVSSEDREEAPFAQWDKALEPHYRMDAQLGAGAYGVVASAICLTRASGEEPGAKVAIKRLAMNSPHLLGAKRALREIAMLHRISHHNCISILDLHRSLGADRALFIVTQLMDTDLGQVIDSDQCLSPEHIIWFVYNILCGVLYLHSCGIVHR